MYFEKLPLIYYTLDNRTTQVVRDITVRTKVADLIKDSAYLYEQYSVKDGERPEHLAARFYNNPLLHWIILIANEIIDPYEDWPMSDYDLSQWVKTNMDPNQIHHYENSDGDWVPNTDSGAYPVTNLEQYLIVNDRRRLIKVVKPELVQFFVDEFERLMQ